MRAAGEVGGGVRKPWRILPGNLVPLKLRLNPADRLVGDFTAAIQAHTNWKLRLASACTASTTKTIDPDSLRRDDLCGLGKWLHGTGSRYASDPKFSQLLAAHSQFHRNAAAVARMVETGKKTEAAALVNAHESEFCKTSLEVVGLLMGFRTRYRDT